MYCCLRIQPGLIALVALLGFSEGCGGSHFRQDLPLTVPVSGLVTLNGKPLASASVTFYPKDGTAGIESAGSTDESGHYQLQQTRGELGTPVGEYSVTISHYVGPDGKSIVMTKDSPPPADLGAVESLPEKYSSLQSTTLRATVPAGGDTINFDLKIK